MAYQTKKIDDVRLIHVPDPGSGIVFVQVLFEGGSLLDPPGKEGLAYLTARMLVRGTKSRTYDEIVDEVAFLGAELETTAQKEVFGIFGDFMPRFAERFASLVADLLANPTFPKDGFEQERKLVLEDLLNLRNDDVELAKYFYSRFLYRDHPLGRPTAGYLDTVTALTASDCADFYNTYARRGNLIVVLAGDIDASKADDFVRTVAKGLRPGRYKRMKMPDPPRVEGLHILVVDKPERTQTQVVMGRPSLGWRDPDIFPVMVGNTAFGGTFTSRLMREIREKRGWSYGVSSAITIGREFGTLFIRFFPSNKDTVPAIRLAIDLMRELVTHGLKPEEVDFAKNHLANQYPFKIETAKKRADEALADMIYKRPRDFMRKYVTIVRAQKSDVVNKAMAKWFHPDGLVIVIVGTASDLISELKTLPGLRTLLVQPYDNDRLQPEVAK